LPLHAKNIAYLSQAELQNSITIVFQATSALGPDCILMLFNPYLGATSMASYQQSKVPYKIQ